MWFRKGEQKVVYRTIEVDKGVDLPPLSEELKEGLKTLQHNFAFQYLVNRLKLERAELQRQLAKGFTLDEQQLHFIQSGIFYCGWLEDTIARLTHIPKAAPKDVPAEVEDLFKQHADSYQFIE